MSEEDREKEEGSYSTMQVEDISKVSGARGCFYSSRGPSANRTTLKLLEALSLPKFRPILCLRDPLRRPTDVSTNFPKARRGIQTTICHGSLDERDKA